MRLRLTFSKKPELRYISHLDLHRLWERSFRRANLPLAYSQGYNPHPRINLACALPLGFTGSYEVVDVRLSEEIDISKIQPALQIALPPGLEIEEIEQMEDNAPVLQAIVESSEYTITLLNSVDDMDIRVRELLAAPSIPRRRRAKDYDLRPLILDIQVLENNNMYLQKLLIVLSAKESATGRPEEVIAALGIEPEMARYHRNRIIFKQNQAQENPFAA